MNDDEFSEPDFVVQTLGNAMPDHGGPLRAVVLARTVRILRRRHVVQRCTFAAALAGCYLAGALSVQLWNRVSHPAAGNLVEQNPVIGSPGAPNNASPIVPVVTPQPGAIHERPLETADVERTRFEALRHAGDLQLERNGDLQAAVRFYKRALDIASKEELAVSVETDNWLLMSLKEARLQEAHHAREGG